MSEDTGAWTSIHRFLVAGILLALAAPHATAFTSGQLDVQPPIMLPSESDLTTPGGLVVLRNLTTLDSLRLTAGAAEIDLQEITYIHTKPVAGLFDTKTELRHSRQVDRFDNGLQVEFELLQPVSFLAASPVGAHDITLESTAPLTIESKGPELIQSEDRIAGVYPWSFVYEYDQAHVLVEPVQGSLGLTSEYALYVYGARIRVTDSTGAIHTYDTGAFTTNDTAASEEQTDAWAILTLKDASLLFDITEPGVQVRSDSLTAMTTGAIRLEDARGEVSDGTYAYTARSQPVQVRGHLTIEVAPTVPHGGLALAQDDAPRVMVLLTGSIDSVNLPRGRAVGGVPGFVESPAGKTTILGSLASLALVGGYVTISRRRENAPFVPSWLRRTIRDDVSAAFAAAHDADRWLGRKIPFVSAWLGLRKYRRAQQLLPPWQGAVRFWHGEATCLLLLGQVKRAQLRLEQVVREQPQNEYPYYDLARALAYRDDAQGALAALDHALQLNPYLAATVKVEPAFRRLRGTARFQALLEAHC